jgi:predicted DNA-binding ribbon-helix-helix protein
MTEATPLRKTEPSLYVVNKTLCDQEVKDRQSTLVSRNITILGRRTSVRLEPEMWNALRDIAKREGCSTHDICSLINIRKNMHTSLTGAIRVFLMLYYRAAATEDGHARVGHGNFETMKRRAQLTKELHEYRPSTQGGMSDSPQEVFAGITF